MEYVYSAMLLHSAGKKITEENVKKVLTAAGVKADDAKIKALTASLEGVDIDGVNIDEAIKTAAVPVATAPSGAAPAEEKPEGKKEEKKKKEEKEEVSEEEAAAGLGALFG